ncbi:MAG: polysaccharide pyruvyl transferase family protein [Candidatus Saccharibacteria bacterium]|nr:polysaccharide pyruvyl transferase family protein [Candidatus Saccharibacteria bacterium]
MKNVTLFNPACGSQNLGDHIIDEATKRELAFLLQDSFVVEYPTHTPVVHWYQRTTKNAIIKFCEEANLKLLSGTNILKYNMRRLHPDWNISLFSIKPYKGVILAGVGSGVDRKHITPYTKFLYKRFLNQHYIHSTRDERTKNMLIELGFKAINTGCPTLWQLTKEHCKKIPTKKAPNAIFTLTDYWRDYEKDQDLINILNKNYKNVYFWIQGSKDYEYFKVFKNTSKIKIINPTLEDYRHTLQTLDADYVGTRLHGGIFAMQNFKRAIILAIDNRTRDMQETYNLNVVERDEINEKLEPLIHSKIITDVHVNFDNINEWKRQFDQYIAS